MDKVAVTTQTHAPRFPSICTRERAGWSRVGGSQSLRSLQGNFSPVEGGVASAIGVRQYFAFVCWIFVLWLFPLQVDKQAHCHCIVTKL